MGGGAGGRTASAATMSPPRLAPRCTVPNRLSPCMRSRLIIAIITVGGVVLLIRPWAGLGSGGCVDTARLQRISSTCKRPPVEAAAAAEASTMYLLAALFFFFVYSLLACDLSDHGEIMYCLLSAQWRHVASSPFALRPGLSHEDVLRTKGIIKER